MPGDWKAVWGWVPGCVWHERDGEARKRRKEER